MRISSQNNTFVFNLPTDFIDKRLNDQFQKLLEKNFIPYDSVIDYMNSSIKEIVFPSLSFETTEQVLKRGKKIGWKTSTSIFDAFSNELDITFRSVDSNLNYFILLEILVEYYLNNDKKYIPMLWIDVIDKDGVKIYTIKIEEVLLKSISELRLGYQQYDISEKTFSITFRYNFIDIVWELDNSKSIFDIPIDFKNGKLDNM